MVFSSFEQNRDIDLIYEWAKSLKGTKILEIGCGGGERSIYYKNAGCKLTAIDVVDVRKPNFSDGWDFLIAEGEKLPFVDESFDAVASFDVIEHIDKDVLFLSEAYRVCKKGGVFILGTPNRNRLSYKLRQLLGKKIIYPLELGKNCIHLREYTMDDLIRLVKKVGFKVIKEEYVWFGGVGIFGFRHFPAFLNKWVQYLLIFAIKP